METKASKKNAQKKRARQRHRDDKDNTEAMTRAARKIQLQVRFNSLCAGYSWMIPEKERLLDHCISSLQGVIHGWFKEAISMYLYMYRIVGVMNDAPISTSIVLYFFLRGEDKYVFTKSGRLYMLKDPMRGEDKFTESGRLYTRSTVDSEKRMEAIEIRGRILMHVES